MNKSSLITDCGVDELIVVDVNYSRMNPTQCGLKANDIVCWLIDNDIRHEMIYDNWAEEIPIAVGFENSDDATLFKLKWS